MSFYSILIHLQIQIAIDSKCKPLLYGVFKSGKRVVGKVENIPARSVRGSQSSRMTDLAIIRR